MVLLRSGELFAIEASHSDSVIFQAFLDEAAKMITPCHRRNILILDNASWHKSKTVRAFLTEHPGKFHLIALPTYAPEENPQEHIWKAGRANITHNRFIENIDAATDEFVGYLNYTKFGYKFL